MEFPFIRFQFGIQIYMIFMRVLEKLKRNEKNVRGINAWVRNKKFISGYILIMIITYDR